MPATRESLLEDAQWVRTILSGTDRARREDCFRSLMLKYWKLVAVIVAHRLGERRDAEDVTQEAFFRAFHSLDKLSEPAAFLGWLLRIAQNLATDRLRARRHVVSLDSLGEAATTLEMSKPRSTPHDFETALESEEITEQLVDALAELPEKYREVVTLRYMRGLDGKEMAQILGEPEGTVRNRLFRALEKLRMRMEKLKAHKP